MMVLALSWGGLVIVGVGAFAIGILLIGLGLFVTDEILDVEDPEDRWARERETRR